MIVFFEVLARRTCFLSVGTVQRHEKVGIIVLVFRCLREGFIYNVSASIYTLA
jgi:hypothetical protein